MARGPSRQRPARRATGSSSTVVAGRWSSHRCHPAQCCESVVSRNSKAVGMGRRLCVLPPRVLNPARGSPATGLPPVHPPWPIPGMDRQGCTQARPPHRRGTSIRPQASPGPASHRYPGDCIDARSVPRPIQRRLPAPVCPPWRFPSRSRGPGRCSGFAVAPALPAWPGA